MYDAKSELRPLTMNFPTKMLEDVDQEVSKGYFSNRSEFIRAAVLAYLRQESQEARA